MSGPFPIPILVTAAHSVSFFFGFGSFGIGTDEFESSKKTLLGVVFEITGTVRRRREEVEFGSGRSGWVGETDGFEE